MACAAAPLSVAVLPTESLPAPPEAAAAPSSPTPPVPEPTAPSLLRVCPSGVWFSDEMRLGLHGQVRRVWGPIGEKVVQRIQIEYRWIYLVLAVDPVRGEVRWQWAPNMKSETLAPVIEGWRREGLSVLVWDGAPGHRGAPVRQVPVVRVPLPAYSPELDPAERIFREIRRTVEGEVYDSLQDKQKRVEQWLLAFAADPTRVRALTGWDWLVQQLRPEPPSAVAA